LLGVLISFIFFNLFFLFDKFVDLHFSYYWTTKVFYTDKFSYLSFKQNVFELMACTPEGIKLVKYMWIYMQKQNKNYEIVRDKARLVTHWFFFFKSSIVLWRDIYINIGCNNILIFNYPNCTRRSAFTSSKWCYNLFVQFSWEWYLYEDP